MPADPFQKRKTRTRATVGKKFQLTGLQNVSYPAASSSSEDHEDAAKSIHSPGQASFLRGLITEARKGNGGTDPKPADEQDVKASEAKLTAEQLAKVQNILATLSKHGESAEETERRLREQSTRLKVPVDINGHNNYSKDPVYYRPLGSSVRNIAGVPHPVSDIDSTCTQCTYSRKCDRHRHNERRKTDISLCSDNHVRMGVWWDATDPENRQGSWRFQIAEKFDRFDNSRWEREDHERAVAAKRKAQERDEEITKEEQGCCPVEPKWRIKKLAERIVDDYNEDQKNIARRAVLDPMGREYYTKPHHWGGRDPFTPSPNTCTRLAHEYKPSDGRVERELRVLLQAWHKSRVKPEMRMRDRTSENAKQTWAEKKSNLEKAKVTNDETKIEEGEATADPAGQLQQQKLKRSKMANTDRFKMTTRDANPGQSNTDEAHAGVQESKEPKTKTKNTKMLETPPKAIKKAAAQRAILADSDEDTEEGESKTQMKSRIKPATRKLTTEERKLLKQMKKAADTEAKETVGAEATASQGHESIEDSFNIEKILKLVAEESTGTISKTPTQKTTATPKATKPRPEAKPKSTKRKAAVIDEEAEASSKKSRKQYKSVDIIEDSDEDAEYDLPAAPALELPEQREGWNFDEALSTHVEEIVKVVQTDKLKPTNATVVVEQGTTIVKALGVMKKKDQVAEIQLEASSVERKKLEEKAKGTTTSIENAQKNAIENLEDFVPTPHSPGPSSPIAPLPTATTTAPDSTHPPGPPAQKRKPPFTGSPSDNDESPRPKKVAKKVSSKEDAVSPVSGKRKMSIPFVVDTEGDGKWMEEKEDEVEGVDGVEGYMEAVDGAEIQTEEGDGAKETDVEGGD